MKRPVSFERTLFPRESRKHILLVLWWINVCHELSITYCPKLLFLYRVCCVVEALTLWNSYFWFMGLLCSGGNPLAELLSCHWRTDSFHASQLCYSFTHHSCPLSEAIRSWQNFQFHKWGSQELLFGILGVSERVSFCLGRWCCKGTMLKETTYIVMYFQWFTEQVITYLFLL